MVTEAVKKTLNEHNVKYGANTLAGVVSLVVASGIGIGYILISGIGFTTQIIACLVGLVFLSWLCAMIGYDKVIQTIKQIKSPGNQD